MDYEGRLRTRPSHLYSPRQPELNEEDFDIRTEPTGFSTLDNPKGPESKTQQLKKFLRQKRIIWLKKIYRHQICLIKTCTLIFVILALSYLLYYILTPDIPMVVEEVPKWNTDPPRNDWFIKNATYIQPSEVPKPIELPSQSPVPDVEIISPTLYAEHFTWKHYTSLDEMKTDKKLLSYCGPNPEGRVVMGGVLSTHFTAGIEASSDSFKELLNINVAEIMQVNQALIENAITDPSGGLAGDHSSLAITPQYWNVTTLSPLSKAIIDMIDPCLMTIRLRNGTFLNMVDPEIINDKQTEVSYSKFYLGRYDVVELPEMVTFQFYKEPRIKYYQWPNMRDKRTEKFSDLLDSIAIQWTVLVLNGELKQLLNPEKTVTVINQ